MPNQPTISVFQQLRRMVAADRAGGQADTILLERFLANRDETAFEDLLWRHSGLVWNVCRRVLRNAQDTEDAFQATFLTFIRKAGGIGKRESIGSWLHSVALRTALAARSRRARAATRELLDQDLAGKEVPDDLLWRDLRPVLDKEVNGLSARYRQPFVMCYLEGKTNAEAARQLGCPEGTVVSRLAAARQRLRDRLSRRGITVHDGLVPMILARATADAARVSNGLVNVTVKAALQFVAKKALVEGVISNSAANLAVGVLRSMLVRKIVHATAAILLVGVFCGGAGLSIHHAAAQIPAGVDKTTETPPARVPPVQAKDDLAHIQGTWIYWTTTTETVNGVAQPPKKVKLTWSFQGDKVTESDADGYALEEYSFRLDSSKNPKAIDLINDHYGKGLGIYAIDGDSLRISYDYLRGRPAKLATDCLNLQRVSRKPTLLVQQFASAPGCYWMIQPKPYSPGCAMWATGANFLEDKDGAGAAIITLAYGRSDSGRELRPVFFDAQRKRHLPTRGSWGYSGMLQNNAVHVVLGSWRMDPNLLPANMVTLVGIEAVPADAKEVAAGERLETGAE